MQRSPTPAMSSGIEYEVELKGDADRERLEALVAQVDAAAETPSCFPRHPKVALNRPGGGWNTHHR